MKPELKESELIKAIISRKPTGSEALYDQYALIIFKVICCKEADRITAENIHEETFLRIWNDIEDYDPEEGRLFLWITKIASGLGRLSCALKVAVQRIDNGIADIDPTTVLNLSG